VVLYYLDASAWSKRYTSEFGKETLDALMAAATEPDRVHLTSSTVSYAELIAVVVRFRNRTALDAGKFDRLLKRITADEAALTWLPLSEETFRTCTNFIIKHNLNATDAALLSTLLDLRRQSKGQDVQIWLVASDKRFLRAASAEGLPCLDPEVISPREVYEMIGRG
jgi:predicted nucleic acid-binding protein